MRTFNRAGCSLLFIGLLCGSPPSFSQLPTPEGAAPNGRIYLMALTQDVKASMNKTSAQTGNQSAASSKTTAPSPSQKAPSTAAQKQTIPQKPSTQATPLEKQNPARIPVEESAPSDTPSDNNQPPENIVPIPAEASSNGGNNPFNSPQKPLKAVSYSPLEAIAVFPVIKHGREKAFGDLPMIFAREFALKLESIAPNTRIYHPIYTVEELRLRGLGHVYDQIMHYYLRAGRPEPKALSYLLKQLEAADGKNIARVIFIEADLDMLHPDENSGLFERINGWLTDSLPKQMKYFISSRVQVFDTEPADIPMVWGGSWRRSIKANQFLNVTPSTFSDSDSQGSFASLSRTMSREILWLAPKKVYMAPQYDFSVHGKLAQDKQMAPSLMTQSEKTKMNEGDKAAIQRVLQRQNIDP